MMVRTVVVWLWFPDATSQIVEALPSDSWQEHQSKRQDHEVISKNALAVSYFHHRGPFAAIKATDPF